MKKFLKITVFLVILALGAVLIYFDATVIAPRQIRVRTETLESEKIPEELDNLQILFFSDVHYNNFVDDARLEKIIDEISDIGADVVLFGGDLFDHPANNIPDEQKQNTVLQMLGSIQAPLGKFAVLGNHDLESQSSEELVSQLLYKAGFEVLNNQSVRIRNHGTQSIALVGLESQMLGHPDPDAAYQNISPQSFTVTLCHTPDTVMEIPQDQTDLMLAGHSHGGQVYLPLIGSFYKPNYAEIYYRGRHQVNNILLDVSNGTGTTRMDVRLFAPAEIVVYRLKHAEPEPTAVPEAQDPEVPTENPEATPESGEPEAGEPTPETAE